MEKKDIFLKDLFDSFRPVMNDPSLTYEEFLREKGKDEELFKVVDSMLNKGWDINVKTS